MNTTGQARAAAGGQVGVNGEWYEGGKFLPSREDRSKQAPQERHQLSAEEQARRAQREQEQDARLARLNAWIEKRRTTFGGIIQQLTQMPADYWGTPAMWAQAVENHNAGFHASLGQSLRASGSVSPRQAQWIAKFVHGRRTKKNAFGFDALVEELTEEWKG